MSDLREELQSTLGAAYILERELGGGGMSRVFLAEETALGRKVVVKVLSPELLAGVNMDRFRREIQLAARLQQAQIVPVLSAGETNGVPYYTMPFVDGESLRQRLTHGPLPVHDVVNILRDVTRALSYAHEHGVVHRDIKPDNVLLSGGTAVVTDFGIAKALTAAKDTPSTDSSLTQLGTSVGTPSYISPEQAAGDPDIDARSDIYSLGCMAYELLTGKPPFADRTPQRTLAAHLTEKPAAISQLRHDIPASLSALVMRCLEKDPAARPQSANEILASLDAVASDSFAAETGGLFVQRISPGAGMAMYAAAFVAVALLAKAAVVGFGLPDWVFVGAVTLMVLGLPAMVLAALGRSTRVTWSRTARGVGLALGAFGIAVIGVMVLRVMGIGPSASLLAAGKMRNREPLLIIDFNAGKDSSLSHVVTEAVRTNLGQSRVVSIMAPASIVSALQRMQRPASTPLDLQLARDIAQREGIKAIVTGDVTQLGAGYVVAVRLVSADSGNNLAAYSATANGTSDLLDVIDGLTRKLRGRIGESLRTVRDAPALDQVTTSSLEALRKYADAIRASDYDGDYAKAATLLREAVALDTTFAMAYRKLGVTLGNLGMPRAQVDSALTRAFRFRDRLPEKERYLTTATYYASGPVPDRKKAAEAYEHVLAIDSTDLTAAVNLAGILRGRRELARADSLFAAVTRARPTQVGIGNYGSLLLTEGKVAQSESVFTDLSKRFPNARGGQTAPPVFMYIRGQSDSAEQFWRSKLSASDPMMKVQAAGNLSSLVLLRGRIAEARKYEAEARALNAARGVPANPLSDSIVAAAVEIWFLEQPDKGIRAIEAAHSSPAFKALPSEQRPYSAIATYYAWAGRPDKARAVLAEWDAEMRDPQRKLNSAPSRHGVMAEIYLAEKKPREAIREMWAADSLPDGPANECAHCLDLDLGRAYDLANMPDSAVAHWERYIDEPFNRSPGRDAPYLAGIHKRLGEIYEAKGDLARAESHYSAFVELWKNADPELQPKVADVKRRLAVLQAKQKG